MDSGYYTRKRGLLSMKKTGDILGYPVIDISTGENAGRVKNIIFNGEEGTVDYLIIENGTDDLMARVIPTSDVMGIGEYAVTIGTKDSIKDIGSSEDAVKHLKRNVKIKDTKVMTKKGTLIGQTGDIYIDEDNGCSMAGLEFLAQSDREDSIQILPASAVITYGKNLIVVENDALERMIDNVDEAVSELEYEEEQDDDASTYAAAAHEDIQNGLEEDEGTGDGEDAEKGESGSAADLFEQRQRQYLVGRRATRTIVDNDGETIVKEGMIINNEIIDDAKKSGKLVELVMNNRE